MGVLPLRQGEKETIKVPYRSELCNKIGIGYTARKREYFHSGRVGRKQWICRVPLNQLQYI